MTHQATVDAPGVLRTEERSSVGGPKMIAGTRVSDIAILPCVDPRFFERERETIFRRSWLPVGRIDDVPEPGSFFVKDIEALPASILVVCGQDKEIRAFYNVCRHRGGMVCPAARGRAKAFSCPFHGWTYDLNGCLVTVPNEHAFEGLDKHSRGLVPIATQVWQGFIFINVDPAPREGLRDFLGELWDGYDGYFDGKVEVAAYSTVAGINWKIFLDAFGEVYHFNFIHKNSASDRFSEVLAPRLYKRHHVISALGNPNYRPTPAEMLSLVHGHQRLGSEGVTPLPKGVNPERHPAWGSDILVIFPVLDINIFDRWYIAQFFWPVSVDRTYWEFKIYMEPPETAGQRISQEYVVTSLRDIVRQDLSNLELVQRGLRSLPSGTMLASPPEVLVTHLHAVVAEHVGLI